MTVADQSERHGASEVGGHLVTRSASTLTAADATTRFGSGAKGKVTVRLSGPGNGAAADVLRIDAPVSAAGEKVTVFRYGPTGPVAERTLRLNRDGDVPRLVIRDRNRRARTSLRRAAAAERPGAGLVVEPPRAVLTTRRGESARKVHGCSLSPLP